MQQQLLEEELKSVCNLVHIISDRVELEPVGRCFRGNCPLPLHEDHDRSLHVYPGREVWRCFGCESGGGAAEFLAAADQVSRGQAIRALALKYGLATADPVNTINSSPDRFDEIVSDRPYTDPINDYLRQTYLSDPSSVNFQRRLKRLDRVFDVNSLDAEQIYELLRRRAISYIDDRELTAGNLAYMGRLANTFRPRAFSMRTLQENQEPRTVGILISLPTTIQDHAEIELPDGKVHIEDKSRVYDGGTITWCEGEAIYKDLETGIHCSTTLLGCTSKGFSLIQIGDTASPLWVWPREPASIGGRDRPFPYRKPGESKTFFATLESFFIENSLGGPIPESFTDMSGVRVPINVPKSNPRRHADRIRLIREMDSGVE